MKILRESRGSVIDGFLPTLSQNSPDLHTAGVRGNTALEKSTLTFDTCLVQ